MNCKNCCNMGCKYRYDNIDPEEADEYIDKLLFPLVLMCNEFIQFDCLKYKPDELEGRSDQE